MGWTRAQAAAVGFICAAACFGAIAPRAHAQNAYYQGKRLTLLINFAAGGPTDIEGRIFAKYLGRHIDGQPNVIVQNMDGAGGLIGAQYLGEIAPKDGTVLGYLTGTAWIYASDPDRWRVDFRNYEFVAHQPGTTIHFVRTDVAPGMKEPADIVKAQGLIAGGLSADTSKDLRLRLALDMLGVPFKYVTGLPLEPAGTARAAAWRDQHVLGIAAELSRRGRAADGEDRPGDPGVLRRGRRSGVSRQAARRPIDSKLPGALQEDQRHYAVRRVLGGLSHAVRDELADAARSRVSPWYAARGAGCAPHGD
jgi:hypothetical protein